jgi:DNA-binding GntR family transcriptional regulator
MMGAAERAYASIRQGILHGIHAAGTRLTEQELAHTAGVSRTPIREALRRLHAEGLVQFEPNHGAVVSLFGAEEAGEIFELRAVLEPICARRAAERASAGTVVELRQLAEAQLAESTRRATDHLLRIGQINDKFHRLIQSAASSVRLEKALAGLIEAPLIMRTFRQYTPAELIRSARQHLELVQAFQERDPTWAHSIMTSHIHAARATYLRSRLAIEDPGDT